MPGLAGGDVFGGGGGEQQGIWGDADATEVEAIGIEADGEGGIGLGRAAVVDLAGGDENVHAEVVELEVTGLAEFEGELCATLTVLGVSIFVFPTGVVEDGKKADDFLIGGVKAGEVKAIAANGEPMGWTVVGFHIQAELGGDELPEREFGRLKEADGHVFRFWNGEIYRMRRGFVEQSRQLVENDRALRDIAIMRMSGRFLIWRRVSLREKNGDRGGTNTGSSFEIIRSSKCGIAKISDWKSISCIVI